MFLAHQGTFSFKDPFFIGITGIDIASGIGSGSIHQFKDPAMNIKMLSFNDNHDHRNDKLI